MRKRCQRHFQFSQPYIYNSRKSKAACHSAHNHLTLNSYVNLFDCNYNSCIEQTEMIWLISGYRGLDSRSTLVQILYKASLSKQIVKSLYLMRLGTDKTVLYGSTTVSLTYHKKELLVIQFKKISYFSWTNSGWRKNTICCHYLVMVLVCNPFEKQTSHSRSSTSSKRMNDLEPLT